MLVFLDKQIVFFATPKTATTSLEASFGPHADFVFQKTPAIKHMRPRKFDRLFGKQIEKLAGGPVTKIAIIRDPLEWIGSWYRYRSRDALDGHQNSTKGITFDAFVEEYMKYENRAPFADLGSQAAFLQLGDGSLGVDKLFKFDDMALPKAYLERALGVQVQLDMKNSSPILPMALDPNLQTQFEQRFAGDYALYHSAQG